MAGRLDADVDTGGRADIPAQVHTADLVVRVAGGW